MTGHGQPREQFLPGVLTEIGDEVRRRRMAGDLLPSFEQELDDVFAGLTPDRQEGLFSTVLELAEESSFVDLEAPVRSDLPGGEWVKRGLRKGMWWYLDYLVQQLSRFTSASTRLAELLDERVSQLEGYDEGGRDARNLLPPYDHEPWIDLVLTSTGATTGPILHADCAEGRLLEALVDHGAAAYGVDTRGDLLDRAAGKGLDVRLEDALRHLHRLKDSSLGGVVLSGYPDARTLAAQRRLVGLVGAKVLPGGVLVLLGTSPGEWARTVPVVVADLTMARPLHAETWRHLIIERGFTNVEVHHGASENGFVPGAQPDPSDPTLTTLNANLGKLDKLLFGATTFAVVGVRSA